jgi:hypothetical protein
MVEWGEWRRRGGGIEEVPHFHHRASLETGQKYRDISSHGLVLPSLGFKPWNEIPGHLIPWAIPFIQN